MEEEIVTSLMVGARNYKPFNIVNHGTYATFNCNGGGGEETTCTKTDRAVVTFYKDINYGGDAVGLPEGSFTKSQMGAYCLEDNWVSSLKVLPGYKVTVYVDDNFGGSSKTHTSNVSYVGDDWNDKISSIKIEPKGVSGFSGIYKIKGHNGQYLDLDGNSSENNTHVVQFTDEGTEFINNGDLLNQVMAFIQYHRHQPKLAQWIILGKVDNHARF